MKVHLTFDVEIWCNGWRHLDRDFPRAYERYVVGRSEQGDFALPATLEILQRFGLRGVFFVEPLFAARFGERFLERIVRMIEDAGQNVQLHLHPEWVDEISPAPIRDASRKRQHLCHYTCDEQRQLMEFGLAMLRRHARSDIYAFRAGSYAANMDTYAALAAAGLSVDSSLNRIFDVSGTDVPQRADTRSAIRVSSIDVYPITVFTDGLGRERPCQVGACGIGEMRQALDQAGQMGRRHFVFVSHNFEMLRSDSSAPDGIVVRRFTDLCRFLASDSQRFDVGLFPRGGEEDDVRQSPRASRWATVQRLAEQARRRWHPSGT